MTSCGNVYSLNNVISWLRGSNNVGTVTNSVFVRLDAAYSSLNVMNSVNCKFDIKNTRLNAYNNVNTEVKGEKGDLYLKNNYKLKIKGESNKAVFQENAYSKFEGDQNECTFKENVNLEYCGDNGKCSFIGNTNAKLLGNNNEVSASNNVNLKVEGGNHLLSISGTANHNLQALKENSSEHVLRLVPPNGANQTGFFGRIKSNICRYLSEYGSVTVTRTDLLGVVTTTTSFGINSNKIGNGGTYYIDYVKEATINNSEYNLGIFNLNIVEKDKQAQLTFDISRFDSGSFAVTNPSAGKYTITGTKDGKTISVIGPSIALSGTNQLIVTL